MFNPIAPPARGLGALGADPGYVRSIIGEIRELWASGGQGFGAFMVRLQTTASQYREAREGFSAAGDEAAADEAQRQYDRTMQVYDALAQVYRVAPDLGIADFEQGASSDGDLGWLPIVLGIAKAISMIVGSAGLLAWAASAFRDSGSRQELAAVARSACAVDPDSPGCRAALDAAAPAPSGAARIPWTGILIVGGLFAAASAARSLR